MSVPDGIIGSCFSTACIPHDSGRYCGECNMPIFLMASAKSNSKKDKDIAKTIEFCPLCAPRGINDLRLLFEKGQKKRPVENDLVVPSPKKKSRSEAPRTPVTPTIAVPQPISSATPATPVANTQRTVAVAQSVTQPPTVSGRVEPLSAPPTPSLAPPPPASTPTTPIIPVATPTLAPAPSERPEAPHSAPAVITVAQVMDRMRGFLERFIEDVTVAQPIGAGAVKPERIIPKMYHAHEVLTGMMQGDVWEHFVHSEAFMRDPVIRLLMANSEYYAKRSYD